jgi:hypothetical protein
MNNGLDLDNSYTSVPLPAFGSELESSPVFGHLPLVGAQPVAALARRRPALLADALDVRSIRASVNRFLIVRPFRSAGR